LEWFGVGFPGEVVKMKERPLQLAQRTFPTTQKWFKSSIQKNFRQIARIRTQTELHNVRIIRPQNQRSDKDNWNGSQCRQTQPNTPRRHFIIIPQIQNSLAFVYLPLDSHGISKNRYRHGEKSKYVRNFISACHGLTRSADFTFGSLRKVPYPLRKSSVSVSNAHRESTMRQHNGICENELPFKKKQKHENARSRTFQEISGNSCQQLL